jgi:light-harvesting complex I chlorophyll a/b binding protein 4
VPARPAHPCACTAGYDPLGLGADPAKLAWNREAELVHSRWAMLGMAGILGQEILNPSVFFYDAPTKAALPFDILGLVAVQFLLMHWVEVRRWRDFVKPGSVDKDPIFAGNALPSHAVGYPGGIFDPLNFAKPGPALEELKVKELKNGRLAMLAFVGCIMAGQVTGKGPLANLGEHLASPMSTSIMAKSVVTAAGKVGPACAIPTITQFQGIEIPTPCFLEAFWP